MNSKRWSPLDRRVNEGTPGWSSSWKVNEWIAACRWEGQPVGKFWNVRRGIFTPLRGHAVRLWPPDTYTAEVVIEVCSPAGVGKKISRIYIAWYLLHFNSICSHTFLNP